MLSTSISWRAGPEQKGTVILYPAFESVDTYQTQNFFGGVFNFLLQYLYRYSNIGEDVPEGGWDVAEFVWDVGSQTVDEM